MRGLTEAERQDIRGTQLLCLYIPMFAHLASGPLTKYAEQRKKYVYAGICRALPLLSLVNFPFIADFIVYFGLLKILTLGYQIEKILPTSCERLP